MADLDYLEGGYTPPKKSTTTEGGSLEDYAVSANIFGMSYYHPETNTNVDTYKDNWDADRKVEIFKGLKTPQEYSLLNTSFSEEHYNLQKAKSTIAREAEARIQNDNPIMQFTGQAGMSLLDPTIMAPGTLAFKGSKTLVALNRIAYGAGTGAGINMLQESVLSETTARDAQLGSAAFWGSVIGGGTFAIGPMLSGGKYISSAVVAKAYTEPSIVEKAMSGELKDINYKPGDDFFTYIDDNGIQTKVNIAGVGLEPVQLWKKGEAPAMNKYIQPFVISPTSRLARSKYPLFNRIGSMMQSSPIYRTMEGKLFSEGHNSFDVKQELTSRKGVALKEMFTGHIEAQRNGYKGNFNEYARAINDAIDDLIEENMNLVYSKIQGEMTFIDAVKQRELDKIVQQGQQDLTNNLKNQIKAGTPLEARRIEMERLKEVHDTAVAKAQEEYLLKFEASSMDLKNRNFQIRLHELLDEASTNISLKNIDPHLHQGVRGYQNYVSSYYKTMTDLQMKGVSTSHPMLYKTRSWNLDALAAKSDNELRVIIRKAFINDPMNKLLIKNKRIKPSTVDKRIEEIVQHMREADLVRMMPDSNVVVPKEMPLGQFLQRRNFNLSDKHLGDLIDRDIRSSMETYNYNMSGRVALQTMFGTDNLQVLQREVVLPAVKQAKEMGATRKEIDSLSDDFSTLFEQILGTHGLPAKPNAWGERATRMLMKLNYLTFGGGFGINALADLGVVAFTNGLTNTIKHFGPSLAAIRDMKAQSIKTPWVEQAIALGALSDFYAARALSRFDDMDTMFTQGRAERWLDKGGQVMQNASGLQHITAIEELMAIGGGTVDIVNTARKFKETGKLPYGFEERIVRYGLSKEDLTWIASQPLDIQNGYLIDFNWDKWDDKQRMSKFQTAVTKMMNDAVIRGDKTLLPQYMTSANPFMRLMTQFMRYPHIAYERVLLRGASKPDARFMVGAMTSAATMSSIYYIREQALIEAGVIKERDAKYAIYDKFGRFDEEAMARLSQVVLMKMPQFGIVPDAIAKGAALSGRTMPGRTYEENPYTAIGGVSASRFEMLTKGLKSSFDGEFDSMDGYYMGKSITIFQNYLQLDQVYNPMAKELLK